MRFLVAFLIGVAAIPSFAQRPPGPPPGGPGGPGRPGPPRSLSGDAAILDKVLRAQPKLRFSGTRSVDMMVNGEKVSIVEYVLRDGLVSRIEYPSNSFRKGFIVVESADVRLEYDPSRNEIRRSSGGRANSNAFLGRLMDGWRRGDLRLRKFDGGTVAGQKASGIEVSDPSGNVVQRYWVDSDTFVVLKAAQYGRGGEERSRFEFKKIDYSPKFPDGWNEIRRAGAKVVDERKPEDLGFRPLLPTWLPAGFKETGRGVRENGPERVLLIHFSDGRRHVSIFQSDAPRLPGVAPRDLERFAVRSAKIGPIGVVVMGDVDGATLERILRSMS